MVNVFAEERRAMFEDAPGMNEVDVEAPRRLRLSVDDARAIFVAGRVIEQGRRTVSI